MTERLAALLDEAVASRVFPGAVLRVDRLPSGPPASPLLLLARGRVSSTPPGAAVRPDTRYDLASLTKLHTALLVLRLASRRLFSLDDDAGSLLGEPESGPHRGMSVRQLLEHRSGLPAWRPFYDAAASANPAPGARWPILAAALAESAEPGRPPGSSHLYSDVGYLVLMALVERVSGVAFESLIQSEVLDPIGLSETSFGAVGLGPERAALLVQSGSVAATEHCPRRGLLCGEVHDDNAWAMGGVASHAGLFAPAADVARLAAAVADPASSFLPPELAAAIFASPAEGGSHVLGWDSPALHGSSCGGLLSRRSRGHLGFTGCSLWVDPDRGISVVLLSNRVHPSRSDERIRAFRPALHDAVAHFVDSVR